MQTGISRRQIETRRWPSTSGRCHKLRLKAFPGEEARSIPSLDSRPNRSTSLSLFIQCGHSIKTLVPRPLELTKPVLSYSHPTNLHPIGSPAQVLIREGGAN